MEILKARALLEGINVRPYKDVEELRTSLRYDDNDHPRSKYPRGGTEELLLLERKIANMFDLDQKQLVVFAYGMSGVVTSIESASPTQGTVLLHGSNEYSNNKKYITNTLKKRGIIPITATSYSVSYLNELIHETNPKIIFLETVANGPEIPVLNIKDFFGLNILKKINPIIILDNTLASGIISPKEILNNDLRVIGVESGLKFYTKHKGSLGFIYTNDAENISTLKELRKQTGTAPDLYQTKHITEKLIGKWELFLRNKKIFKNAKLLAELCHEAETPNSNFSISYPNLENHKDTLYVNKTFPEGAAPLFFINSRNGKNQFDIAEELFKNQIINDSCMIIESFGFDFTSIWPNSDLNFVRISAGIEDESKIVNIGNALKETLRKIN